MSQAKPHGVLEQYEQAVQSGGVRADDGQRRAAKALDALLVAEQAQAGLIVGSRETIGRIRRFPMKRALRMSKLPLAALEATLRLYLRPERLAQDLPTLRLLTRPEPAIRALAEQLLPAVAAAVAPRFGAVVVALQGQIGSGSLPVERLPSAGLAIAPLQKKGAGRALDALATALRGLPPPVIGRVADDRLLLDLRCLEDPAPFSAQLPALQAALA